MPVQKLLLGFLLATAGCGGAHLFDADEVPTVEVGVGLRPLISWSPPEAYELNVYRGDRDGDGIGALWTARGPGGYENNLRAPVTYGVPPPDSEVAGAPPLEAGQTYTAVVVRKDPKGSGDGFFNTRHRYVGRRTFVAR